MDSMKNAFSEAILRRKKSGKPAYSEEEENKRKFQLAQERIDVRANLTTSINRTNEMI